MAHEEQDLPPGARLLDRYTVVDCVAGGGMATIHRAVDERFDRIVCVKLLRLDLDGQSSASGKVSASAVFKHFLREARALSQLQHPNTLRIYDFGYLEHGQRPFQVSEFLDGGNLRQHVRSQGALRAEEMLAVLECITGAIAEAHDRKLLHRDIKPSNILFSRVGGVMMPKLADFGIARTLRARQPRAEEPHDLGASQGVGLFSPRWAAPEQLAGRPEGPETDVYSLGLLATYMLAARSPFDGAELLDIYDERARADEVVRGRLVALGLPRQVIQVLGRALAADSAVRTPTAVAFFDEMRNALGGLRAALPLAPAAAPESRALALPPLGAGPLAPPPPPRAAAQPPHPSPGPARQLRVADVHEKVELELVGQHGVDVRFRVSILPARGGDHPFQIQVKGLNCFVSRLDASGSARPTPALSAREDGTVDFVSPQRQVLARMSFAFGRPVPGERGHVFHVAGGDVVVASTEGAFAVALDLGQEREMVVLCKRA